MPNLASLGDLSREIARRNHTRYARLHAHNRAEQRYGVHYDGATRARIVKAIQTGGSTYVEKGRGQRTIHDVEFDGRVVRVLWDKRLREIVTFLPPPDE